MRNVRFSVLLVLVSGIWTLSMIYLEMHGGIQAHLSAASLVTFFSFVSVLIASIFAFAARIPDSKSSHGRVGGSAS